MEKQGVIYKIENLVNGKVYIGQTKDSFRNRRKDHISRLRRNVHENDYLQRSWNKYNEENFIFELVKTCPIDQLDIHEIELIKEYRKNNLCYNLESGGNRNKTLHADTKQRLSLALKDKWEDETYRNKMQNSLMKKVICIDTGVIFESLMQVERELGISYKSLYNVCAGKNKSAQANDSKYYQFAYYEDGKEYQLQNIKVSRIKKPKKVLCITTNTIYNSTQEASRETGANQSKISLCCNKKRNFTGKTADGEKMTWCFFEEYERNTLS